MGNENSFLRYNNYFPWYDIDEAEENIGRGDGATPDPGGEMGEGEGRYGLLGGT